MSIPLDNLYHWVRGAISAPVTMYIFAPHGSKNISDLTLLGPDAPDYSKPPVICHDQEPLNFKATEYTPEGFDHGLKHRGPLETAAAKYFKDHIPPEYQYTLNLMRVDCFCSDQVILLHSEQNSAEVAKFEQQGFIPVHYWAHAIIARDWYRFAKHDVRLHNRNPTKQFLIYSRDWSDGREYRLKFLEILSRAGLLDVSTVSIKQTNDLGHTFDQFKPSNPAFQVNPEFLHAIPDNSWSASASADYQPQDFNEHEISVVLETVFDDPRVHLTEKILRPIACGQPFMLAAGAGSLEYLRRYGFKTFEPYINEDYDMETNSLARMRMIVTSMQKARSLSDSDRAAIREIARYNQQHFFSDAFVNCVTDELKTNMDQAIEQYYRTVGDLFLAFRKTLKQDRAQFDPLLRDPVYLPMLKQFKQLRAQRRR